MIFVDTNQKLKKKNYFILLQNRFDILKPKDFVLLNKNKSNFFLPKLFFFNLYQIRGQNWPLPFSSKINSILPPSQTN